MWLLVSLITIALVSKVGGGIKICHGGGGGGCQEEEAWNWTNASNCCVFPSCAFLLL